MDNLFGNVTFGEDLIDISEATPKAVETAVEKTTPDKPVGEDDFIEVQVGSLGTKINEDIEEEELEEIVNSGTETPPAKPKGSSSSSPFKPFAKALSEEGFLPEISDEEFDSLAEELGSPQAALMELSRRSIQADIDDYKKSAEGDYKAFIEARDAGLDLNVWADIQEAKNYYSSITEEKIDDDEALQKELITEHLRSTGLDEETISSTIESWETTGKLLDNAKKAHTKLIKFAEKQEAKLKEDKVKQDEANKKAREESLKALRKEVDSMNEIIPGIKINKQTKDKLYTNITTVVKTGANGEQYNAAMAKRLEDPIKYALIENYLIELGVFDGKWDKIVTRTKAKAVSELEKALSESSNTDFGSGKNTLGSGMSDDDIDFNLGSFKKK